MQTHFTRRVSSSSHRTSRRPLRTSRDHVAMHNNPVTSGTVKPLSVTDAVSFASFTRSVELCLFFIFYFFFRLSGRDGPAADGDETQRFDI